MRNSCQITLDQALKVSSVKNFYVRIRGWGSFRGREMGWGIGTREKISEKASIECYNCYKIDHF